MRVELDDDLDDEVVGRLAKAVADLVDPQHHDLSGQVEQSHQMLPMKSEVGRMPPTGGGGTGCSATRMSVPLCWPVRR